jgi:hypothetical protein
LSTIKTLVASALLGTAALTGAVGAAEAHGRHGLFVVLGNGGGHDCSFYYWKWQATGKLKWMYRYQTCIRSY